MVDQRFLSWRASANAFRGCQQTRPRRRSPARNDMVTTAMLELDQEHAGELGRAGDRR